MVTECLICRLLAGFGDKVKIEVFDHARYFTVTGDTLYPATPQEIKTLDEGEMDESYSLCHDISAHVPGGTCYWRGCYTGRPRSRVQVFKSNRARMPRLLPSTWGRASGIFSCTGRSYRAGRSGWMMATATPLNMRHRVKRTWPCVRIWRWSLTTLRQSGLRLVGRRCIERSGTAKTTAIPRSRRPSTVLPRWHRKP